MMPAMRSTTFVAAAAALALATGLAVAQAPAAGVRVGHAYASPSRPGAANGAVYATIENAGAAPDRLLRASTRAAARVELHTMALESGVMRMREVEAVALPARQTVSMRPGQGFHLMLMQLTAPLKSGESFPLVLEIEKGGKVEVKVEVHEPRAGGAEHKH